MEFPLLVPTQAGQSLVDAIYVTLRDAIIRGDFPAGMRLREIPLATHFDVSTTPVRSALQRLDFEGLVEISPRRGAVVAAVDHRELEDLYELRHLLECHALGAAAKRGGHDLTEIDGIIEQGAQAVANSDQARFNECDLDFHGQLTALGGNAELQVLAAQTHRRIQAVRTRHAVELPEQLPVSQQEHEAIVDALRDGEAPIAVKLLRRHITSVRDTVLAAVRHDASPS